MTFEKAQELGYDLTRKEYEALTKTMLSNYQQAYRKVTKDLKDVYAKLSNVDPEDYYNYMSKAKRLEKLQQSIAKNYMTASLAAGKTQREASALAISNAYYRQMYATNWVSDDFFVGLNLAVIETSTLGTQRIWNNLRKEARLKMIDTVGKISEYQPKYGTLASILIGNRQKDLQKIT